MNSTPYLIELDCALEDRGDIRSERASALLTLAKAPVFDVEIKEADAGWLVTASMFYQGEVRHYGVAVPDATSAEDAFNKGGEALADWVKDDFDALVFANENISAIPFEEVSK